MGLRGVIKLTKTVTLFFLFIKIFDHPFKGEIKFSIPPFPEKEIENKDFKVGFISGPSGTVIFYINQSWSRVLKASSEHNDNACG